MERYLYQFLAEEYEGEITMILQDQTVVSRYRDASENGFPKPELAEEEVLLIALKNFNTKKMITFGSRPGKRLVMMEYVLCQDEYSPAGYLRRLVGSSVT